MIRTARLWSLVALILVSGAAFAQERPTDRFPVTFSIGGGPQGATKAAGLAVGWSFPRAMRDVTISAQLVNGSGFSGGIAYLMRSVGPGTTPADEVAEQPFEVPFGHNDLVELFTGLTLPAGDYWLTFGDPKGAPFSYLSWVISQPVTLNARGVHYLGTRMVQGSPVADYAPSSDFGDSYTTFGYQVSVTASRDDQPKPLEPRPVQGVPSPHPPH